MKSVLINTIGEPKVLDVQNIPKPKITNAYEVLVRIKAASVNPIDIKLRAGDYPLNNFPAILGCDAAGIVDEVGSKVTKVKKSEFLPLTFPINYQTLGEHCEKF